MLAVLTTHAPTAAVAAVLLLAFYVAARAAWGSETKRRAWLMTLPVSLVMTAVGAWVLATRVGLSASAAVEYALSSDPLSEAVCVVFATFCVVEVAVGVWDFPDQFSLLAGYVHHAAYAAFMGYLLHNGWAGLFALFGVAELPTALIAAGRVFPDTFRSLLGTGVTFFATRICYFFWQMTNVLRVKVTWPLVAMAGAAGLLHLLWAVEMLAQLWRWAQSGTASRVKKAA